jgi:hypothetical protein
MEMKIINGIKTIFAGEVNDATVYATKNFDALDKNDLEFEKPEFIIKCDSGVYPSITNFDQYICDKVKAWFYGIK